MEGILWEGKINLNEVGRQILEKQMFCPLTKHAKLYSDLLQALIQRKKLASPRPLGDRTLISVPVGKGGRGRHTETKSHFFPSKSDELFGFVGQLSVQPINLLLKLISLLLKAFLAILKLAKTQ